VQSPELALLGSRVVHLFRLLSNVLPAQVTASNTVLAACSSSCLARSVSPRGTGGLHVPLLALLSRDWICALWRDICTLWRNGPSNLLGLPLESRDELGEIGLVRYLDYALQFWKLLQQHGLEGIKAADLVHHDTALHEHAASVRVCKSTWKIEMALNLNRGTVQTLDLSLIGDILKHSELWLDEHQAGSVRRRAVEWVAMLVSCPEVQHTLMSLDLVRNFNWPQLLSKCSCPARYLTLVQLSWVRSQALDRYKRTSMRCFCPRCVL